MAQRRNGMKAHGIRHTANATVRLRVNSVELRGKIRHRAFGARRTAHGERHYEESSRQYVVSNIWCSGLRLQY